MSTIKSSTTTTTAYSVTADTTGTLVIQTGSTPTTAVTVGTDQSVTLAGTLAVQSQNMTPYTGFKNRIINGAMVIDQRNAGASVATTTTGSYVYTVDRWAYLVAQASKFTIQQNAGSVTPPAGFVNYLGCTSTSAYTVLTGDYFNINQAIEGFNVSDLGWGSAGAQSVTLSFWVRSSLTGTFGGAFRNSAFNRSYPFTYTINIANTWEQKTITVAGDTSGTWLTTNSVGIHLNFSLGMGATFSGTANTWAGANYASATGATSVVGTNGATFYITGVQLEKGSTATSFDYRPYGTELALCQRYAWVPDGNAGISGIGVTTTSISQHFAFPVQMRSAPTATVQTAGSYTASDDYAGDITASSVSAVAYSVSQNTIRFTLGGFTGVTAGRFYAGLPGGGWTSRFLFSSEL